MIRASLYIFSIILMSVGAPLTSAHAQRKVDLELVLAVDVSGSIDPDEAMLQRRGYVSAFRDPKIVDVIKSGIHGRIAVLYFEWASAGDNRLLVDWTQIFDQASANQFAALLAEAPIRTGFRTSISSAIDFALPRFGQGGVEGTRKVIDISGDGPNNDGLPVDIQRDRAVAMGIAINGLPIINDRPNRSGFPTMPDLDKYYEGCVIGGPNAFVVLAENFASFADAVRRKLILEIANYGPAQNPAKIPSRRTVAYAAGCDIGERMSREYYRQRSFP